MEEPKYYELWCGDGDYYHLTEKVKRLYYKMYT